MTTAKVDVSVLDNVEWDQVCVTLDGHIYDQDQNEMELPAILAAFAAVGDKLRRMVAVATGEDVT